MSGGAYIEMCEKTEARNLLLELHIAGPVLVDGKMARRLKELRVMDRTGSPVASARIGHRTNVAEALDAAAARVINRLPV